MLQAYNSILLLDRLSVLNLSEQFQKKTRVQFLVSGKQLTYYLEANPMFDALVKAILRTYGGAFDNKIDINLQLVCEKAGTNQSGAVKQLRHLEKENLLEFEHDQHDTQVTFLVPREDDATINPLVPYIRQQAENKKEKIQQVLNFISNDKVCKSEQLLQYFGEKRTQPCKKCSVCEPSEEKPDRERMKKIYFSIVGLLEERAHSSREMIGKLPFPEAHILQVLRLLVEKGALAVTADNKYKLKHL